MLLCHIVLSSVAVFFQAEDGIRYRVRSRGLGDVYKRQRYDDVVFLAETTLTDRPFFEESYYYLGLAQSALGCLLYTSDAADERSSVDLGGRRIIKQNTHTLQRRRQLSTTNKT